MSRYMIQNIRIRGEPSNETQNFFKVLNDTSLNLQLFQNVFELS